MSAHFQQIIAPSGTAIGQLSPIGCVHFIGIGGIGMSGIAEIMLRRGFRVQGSDLTLSHNVKRLRGLGIDIFIGHDAAHIERADVVTISSAVRDDNVELVAARKAHVPVVRRAEMLAELMRLKPCITIAGTHGKTTTTSLVASILDEGKLSPTVINGGIITAYGTNARQGGGDWMVVEADESDGTFTHLPSTIAVVTNIDPEHLDYYGDFDGLRRAFRDYVQNIPFYGFGIMCRDHEEVRALMDEIQDRRLLSYGITYEADIRAVNIKTRDGGMCFDIILSASVRDAFGLNDAHMEAFKDMRLAMVGEYNLCNALAGVGVALSLHIPPLAIAAALRGFAGVNRRFTHIGDWKGIRIIDDYAHHPVEIAAVIEAARSLIPPQSRGARIMAIVQPHRYSRLRDMFAAFCATLARADIIALLPVYAAGEAPLADIDTASLADALRKSGHGDVHELADETGLAGFVAQYGRADDIVLCMGAGSISRFAEALPQQLAEGAA